jgi:hypothetical protein
MAWDAEGAIAEGPSGRAQQLVRQCLELVPDHTRCRSVALPKLSGAMPPVAPSSGGPGRLDRRKPPDHNAHEDIGESRIDAMR